MGWWKPQGTDILIGDLPLDTLGAAAEQVAAAYRKSFGRLPTAAEWEVLLSLVLGHEEPETKTVAENVAKVRIELK